MADDRYDLAMAAGEAGMKMMDIVAQDDTLALFRSCSDRLFELAEQLRGHDCEPAIVAHVLVGMALGVALQSDN